MRLFKMWSKQRGGSGQKKQNVVNDDVNYVSVFLSIIGDNQSK